MKSDPKLEKEFKELVEKFFDFVDTWEDEKIDQFMQRMYAKRMPAYEAAKIFVDSAEQRFKRLGINYSVSYAQNRQRTAGTRAEYSDVVTGDMMRALNHDLREPEKLLFYEGAQFEATINGDGYSQSQLLMMLKVPTQNQVDIFSNLELMAAPPNVSYYDVSRGIPSKKQLEDDGWSCVMIGRAPERTVTVRGSVGCRVQYSLKHIGSSTINKQLGNTIKGKCAVECSEDCAPFCKEQVVVGLSRTCRAEDTIIVGDKEFAIGKLWELITISNQWTDYIETILERLSVNGNPHAQEPATIHYADLWPYRTCDISILTEKSGYVYMLVSVRDFDREYIGQTECLSRRVDEHFRGRGSEGTKDPYYHPYCLAAFICGMSHMTKTEREHFEQKWKDLNRAQIAQGNGDIFQRIEQGERIVEEYNRESLDADERLVLVRTIKQVGTNHN